MAGASIKNSYSLRFDDDGIGLQKRVDFEAVSTSIALEIAESECNGRWALLICEGTAMCQIGHNAGAWLIVPVPPRPT